MVKKVKRFIVFVLFSFFYSLMSGKLTNHSGKIEIGTNEAEAKCCPAGSVSLDKYGNCLNFSGHIVEEDICYV